LKPGGILILTTPFLWGEHCQPDDYFRFTVYGLRQNLLLFGSVFLVITIALVIVTTRDLVSRIRLLTLAARRMADRDLISPIAMPATGSLTGTPASIIASVPLDQWVTSGEEALDFLEYPAIADHMPLVSMLKVQLTPLADVIDFCVRGLLKPDEAIPVKRAILLFSGGLDSVTTLYWARREGYDVSTIITTPHSRLSDAVQAVHNAVQRRHQSF
jgi:hypothetical protein